MNNRQTENKKKESVVHTKEEQLYAAQWGMIGGITAYIIVIVVSFRQKFDTAPGNFIMEGMLVFNRGYFMIKKKTELFKTEKVASVFMILGGVVLHIGYL